MSSDARAGGPEGDFAISARGLGKSYRIYSKPSDRLREMLTGGWIGRARDFWALRGVSFEVGRGETLGIVGRNGSGKSTLLEMISGTLEPSEGEVEVRGRVAALLELGAGFNVEFTGRENVRLNGAILGMSKAELADRFDEIVAFADIGDFLDQPVKTYSSGMFSRLAFAVAIHATPDILIVDEILSVGDEAFQRKCFARIEAFKRSGGSILFVSHAASSVIELCDRALLLNAGEPLLLGSPKTVVALYQKLVHAPPEHAEAVGRQIEAEARNPGSYDAGVDLESGEADAPEPEAAEPSEEVGYLDPFLVSQSELVYEPNGAEISEPGVLSLAGEPVNCLVSGQRYVMRYHVRFDKDAADVRYHTLIKTVSGVELGGGTHPASGELGFAVSAGEERVASFEFTCALNPAVYFLNCGVTGNGGRQLHRIVDALAIRVLPHGDPRTMGHVYFDHRGSISDPP